MALFRKFFYRKPPEGLLEISERVFGECWFHKFVIMYYEFGFFVLWRSMGFLSIVVCGLSFRGTDIHIPFFVIHTPFLFFSVERCMYFFLLKTKRGLWITKRECKYQFLSLNFRN